MTERNDGTDVIVGYCAAPGCWTPIAAHDPPHRCEAVAVYDVLQRFGSRSQMERWVALLRRGVAPVLAARLVSAQ